MKDGELEQEIDKFKDQVNEIEKQVNRLASDYHADRRSVKVAVSVLTMCLLGFFGFTYSQIGDKINDALESRAIADAEAKAMKAKEKAQNAADSAVSLARQVAEIHSLVARQADEIEQIHKTYPSPLEKISELEGRIKRSEDEQSTPRFTVLTAGESSKQDLVITTAGEWHEFSDLKITFSLKKPTIVLAFYQVTMAAQEIIGYLSTRLIIDGEDAAQARSTTGNTIYWSPASVWVGELNEGSHTFSVQYRTNQNGINDPTNDWENRVLKVLVLGE